LARVGVMLSSTVIAYYDPIRQTSYLPTISRISVYKLSLLAGSPSLLSVRNPLARVAALTPEGGRGSSGDRPFPRPSPIYLRLGSLNSQHRLLLGVKCRCSSVRFMLRPVPLLASLDRSDLVFRRAAGDFYSRAFPQHSHLSCESAIATR
jgi:hypothetical protein